jgi:hypothetical protein
MLKRNQETKRVGFVSFLAGTIFDGVEPVQPDDSYSLKGKGDTLELKITQITGA